MAQSTNIEVRNEKMRIVNRKKNFVVMNLNAMRLRFGLLAGKQDKMRMRSKKRQRRKKDSK